MASSQAVSERAPLTNVSLGRVLRAPFKMIANYLKRCWVVWRIVPPFLKVFFSKDGIFSPDGRTLIWGKFRRSWLSLVPPVVHHLQKKHGLEGGCNGCGASCKLLFKCPHLDDSNRCTVYEYRPDICRQFPVTPADIRDRNLVLKDEPCGFNFKR